MLSPSNNPRWLANVLNKHYNRVSWLITHNAFNSIDEIKQDVDPNQHYTLVDQLNDGVRAFMLDIHPIHGGLRMQHGTSPESSYKDLCDFLINLKAFLVANSEEVVTLYLEVYGDIAGDLDETFKGRGPGTQDFAGQDWDLSAFLYYHPGQKFDVWPTVNTMISSGARLVVFRENHDSTSDAPFDALGWCHDQWKCTAETPWDSKTWAHLHVNTNMITGRGRRDAPLLTLYHQPSRTTGGSAGFASTANLDDYLFARCIIAWKLTGLRPSPAVDFYQSGDQMPLGINTLNTVERLNAIKEVYGRVLDSAGKPFRETVHVERIENTTFASPVYGLDLSKYTTTEPEQRAKLCGHYSYPLLPGETVNYRLTRDGRTVSPPSIQVSDFSQDVMIDIRVV